MCYIRREICDTADGFRKTVEHQDLCYRSRNDKPCRDTVVDTYDMGDEAPGLTPGSSAAPSVYNFPATPVTDYSPTAPYKTEIRAPSSHSSERRDNDSEWKRKADRRYIVPKFVVQLGSGSSSKQKSDSRRSRSAGTHRAPIASTSSHYRSASDSRDQYLLPPSLHQDHPPYAPEPPIVVPESHRVVAPAITTIHAPTRYNPEQHNTVIHTPERKSSIASRRHKSAPHPVVLHHSVPSVINAAPTVSSSSNISPSLIGARIEERRPRSSSTAASSAYAPSSPRESARRRYEEDDASDRYSTRFETESERSSGSRFTGGGAMSKEEKRRRQAEYDEQERIRYLNRMQEREQYHKMKEDARLRDEGDVRDV